MITPARKSANLGTEEEVRRLLEARLGLPVSEEELGFLRLQGTLASIQEAGGDPRQKRAALEKAVETLKNLRAVQGQPLGEEPGAAGPLATDEEDRRFALSRLLALEAGQAAEVVGFRERHLAEGLLDLESIGEWIALQAEAQGAPSLYVEIALPAGTQVKATPHGMVAKSEVPVSELPIEGAVRAKLLKYSFPGAPYVQAVPVSAGSTLDELRRLSERLAKSYSWQADQATVFVLSGVTPLVAGILARTEVQSEHLAASRVTLTIDPLVAPQTVLEAYSELRQKVLLGKHRPLSEKHRQLAVFAAERRPEPPGPK